MKSALKMLLVFFIGLASPILAMDDVKEAEPRRVEEAVFTNKVEMWALRAIKRDVKIVERGLAKRGLSYSKLDADVPKEFEKVIKSVQKSAVANDEMAITLKFKFNTMNEAEVMEALGPEYSACELEKVRYEVKFADRDVHEMLREVFPKTDLESIKKIQIAGQILIVEMDKHLLGDRHFIGAMLLAKYRFEGIKTVARKAGAITSPNRETPLEVIAGDDNLVAEIKDDVNLKVNLATTYWGPHLAEEHKALSESIDAKATVFDVFAGVGPYAVRLAKKGCTVIANDHNKEAIEYLENNLRINGIDAENVTTRTLDAKVFIEETAAHFADDGKKIYLMNLPQAFDKAPKASIGFLPSFVGLARGRQVNVPPTVHLYVFESKAKLPRVQGNKKQQKEAELGPTKLKIINDLNQELGSNELNLDNVKFERVFQKNAGQVDLRVSFDVPISVLVRE